MSTGKIWERLLYIEFNPYDFKYDAALADLLAGGIVFLFYRFKGVSLIGYVNALILS